MYIYHNSIYIYYITMRYICVKGVCSARPPGAREGLRGGGGLPRPAAEQRHLGAGGGAAEAPSVAGEGGRVTSYIGML